jgi:hypothetical protein
MRVVIAALALVAVSGATSGCAEACALSCGTGVHVWWLRGDVPEAASYRLCVNGSCGVVEPSPIGGAAQYLGVGPRDASADRHVRVRPELLDEAGAPTAAFTGEGDKTGRCCPGVEMRVRADGSLVVDQL